MAGTSQRGRRMSEDRFPLENDLLLLCLDKYPACICRICSHWGGWARIRAQRLLQFDLHVYMHVYILEQRVSSALRVYMFVGLSMRSGRRMLQSIIKHVWWRGSSSYHSGPPPPPRSCDPLPLESDCRRFTQAHVCGLTHNKSSWKTISRPAESQRGCCSPTLEEFVNLEWTFASPWRPLG